MTTVPSIGSSLSAARIASTAAASAASLSPRPIQADAAIAAASVTRTISRTRTRSRIWLPAARFMMIEVSEREWVVSPIKGLVALVHRMLEKLGAHPDRPAGDRRLDQEDRERAADGQHRRDEQPGNLGPQPRADEA